MITWNSTTPTHWRTDNVDHGLVDEKGRKIGGRATVYVSSIDGNFYAYAHATRDGQSFGAIPRATKCASLEQAQRFAISKLNSQRARYAKQFAVSA
jgi:hypothetical protein